MSALADSAPRQRPRSHLGRGAQSFGAVEVRPVAADPVAAKIDDARVRLIDRSAAGLAAFREPAQHKHPIAEIAEFFDGVLEPFPVVGCVGGESFDASRPR